MGTSPFCWAKHARRDACTTIPSELLCISDLIVVNVGGHEINAHFRSKVALFPFEVGSSFFWANPVGIAFLKVSSLADVTVVRLNCKPRSALIFIWASHFA